MDEDHHLENDQKMNGKCWRIEMRNRKNHIKTECYGQFDFFKDSSRLFSTFFSLSIQIRSSFFPLFLIVYFSTNDWLPDPKRRSLYAEKRDILFGNLTGKNWQQLSVETQKNLLVLVFKFRYYFLIEFYFLVSMPSWRVYSDQSIRI